MKFLIWLDDFVNVTLFKGRWETISGRCYRRKSQGCRVCNWLCEKLGQIDPNHCRKAYFNDRVTNPELPWI